MASHHTTYYGFFFTHSSSTIGIEECERMLREYVQINIVGDLVNIRINKRYFHNSTTKEGLNPRSHKYHDVHKFLLFMFPYYRQNYILQIA